MARNGSGTMILDNGVHQGSTAFEQDRDAGTNILATRVDYAMQDMCNALTGSIATDGQSVVTANIPFGGFKATNLANGTASTDAATINNMQRQTGIYCGTAGGTASAITLSPSPSISAYADGMIFNFLPAFDSATLTACTVAVSGLAAIPLYYFQDTAAAVPQQNPYYKMLLTTRMASIMYIGGKFQLLNPFSAWAAWTPTYGSGTNTMTYTAVTTTASQYTVIGNTCFFYLSASGTTGGTATTHIDFSLPSGVVPTVNTEYFPAYVNASGTPAATAAVWVAADSRVYVYGPTFGNWTLGANRAINVKGFFNIA